MRIEEVVADANVLLSAIIGKAALRVFSNFDVIVHIAQFNVDEVREYLPHMAEKYKISRELVETQWKLLPVRVHREVSYQRELKKAVKDLAKRDPEDAHALALARHLGLSIWSNDRDLVGLGVECLPTARLLALLERG